MPNAAFDAFKESNSTYHTEKENKIKNLIQEMSALSTNINTATAMIEDANKEVK